MQGWVYKVALPNRLSLFPQDGGRYTNREENTIKEFVTQEEQG